MANKWELYVKKHKTCYSPLLINPTHRMPGSGHNLRSMKSCISNSGNHVNYNGKKVGNNLNVSAGARYPKYIKRSHNTTAKKPQTPKTT